MADIPARTELKVTTGPIRGSRKTFVERNGVRVALRSVDLEPTSGEPPVTLYDTSGPYTDPAQKIDIMSGLAELRRDWRLRVGKSIRDPSNLIRIIPA